MATNADMSGYWTIDNTNTASVGRYHDGALVSQAGSALPTVSWRGGVWPDVSDPAANTVPFLGMQVVEAGSPNTTVQIRPGTCIIPRSGQGPYVCTLHSTATVTTDNANATNPRIDRIIVQLHDTALGDAQSKAIITVVTGTAAAIPAVPSVTGPSSWIELAQIAVPANDNTRNNAQITDKRQAASTVGAVRRLGLGDSLLTSGQLDGELRDTGDSIDRWSNVSSAWESVALTRASGGQARYRTSSAHTVSNNTVTQAQFHTGDLTTPFITASGTNNNTFTLNVAGLWLITVNTRFAASGTGVRYSWLSIVGQENTTRLAGIQQNNAGGSDAWAGNFTLQARFTAGQQISNYVLQASGGNLDRETSAAMNTISFKFLAA